MQKNWTKITISFLLCVFAIAGLVGCSKSAPTQDAKKTDAAPKISISHTSSLQSPWEKGSQVMAGIINKEGNGRFKAEVFGNGVLNQKNWKIMFEQTQAGSNVIAIESATALSAVVPEIFAINLPFMFQDEAHLDRFIESNPAILQKWLKKFEEKNLVVLTVAPKPFRQLINNKRLIKTPEDIKDLKFRVPPSPMFVKVFESLGAKPVPLPSSEIYSAIQLGTVVGEDNSTPIVYDYKTHEVAKYMTIWNYIGDASIVVINKDVWNKLSDDDKKLFKKAASEWKKINMTEDAAYSKLARANMEKANVKFHDMDQAGKQPFAKLMEPVYADFVKNHRRHRLESAQGVS